MTKRETRVGPNGGVFVPAHIRKFLDVGPGDVVLFEPGAYGVRVYTRALALRELRATVNDAVSPRTSLLDELRAWKKQDTAAMRAKSRR